MHASADTIATPRFLEPSSPRSQRIMPTVALFMLPVVVALLKLHGPNASKLVICIAATNEMMGTMQGPGNFEEKSTRSRKTQSSMH